MQATFQIPGGEKVCTGTWVCNATLCAGGKVDIWSAPSGAFSEGVYKLPQIVSKNISVVSLSNPISSNQLIVISTIEGGDQLKFTARHPVSKGEQIKIVTTSNLQLPPEW